MTVTPLCDQTQLKPTVIKLKYCHNNIEHDKLQIFDSNISTITQNYLPPYNKPIRTNLRNTTSEKFKAITRMNVHEMKSTNTTLAYKIILHHH